MDVRIFWNYYYIIYYLDSNELFNFGYKIIKYVNIMIKIDWNSLSSTNPQWTPPPTEHWTFTVDWWDPRVAVSFPNFFILNQ